MIKHARQTRRWSARTLVVTLGVAALPVSAAPIALVPDQAPPAVADRQEAQIPDRVQLEGWLGTRVSASETRRLVTLDTERLLEGYYHRPGRQEWDGEHVGKWLHAATLAWVNTGDPALRAKLDRTAAELCQCQLADGYLGTYLPKDHWTSWDVWSHKYNLIGLLTYVRYTGNLAPLATCRRMGDLLCRTFGDGPGQRDIILSGTHVGMAPTSVLVPMAMLYRMTGEPRYLDFCHYLVRSWEQPNGPHIISRLLELKRVDQVGNAKAYEMLSCLNGALELYRTTGERPLLEASRNAWQDIVDHRLYLTGSASSTEHFQAAGVLPNDMPSRICETCVTVTWMQVNLQLLRVTGEAKFADQLETSVYNHLLAAQNPQGEDWCYYTPLEGRKPYDQVITCCHSSGPRGLALLSTFALTTDASGIVINFFDATAAQLALADGTAVGVRVDSRYPADGHIRITLTPAAPTAFTVRLRVPPWAGHEAVLPAGATLGSDGYYALQRTWRSGDTIDLNLNLRPRVVVGSGMDEGLAAVLSGPLVLAADSTLLDADAKISINALALPAATLAALDPVAQAAPRKWKTWPGAQVFRINGVDRRNGRKITARLVPFADAGMTGGRFKVWLPLAGHAPLNLLLDGTESRSRFGAPAGSVNDEDFTSVASTRDGTRSAEDWFAVNLAQPAKFKRVIFTPGNRDAAGGWFDTSSGPPRVQVRRVPGGPWLTVGELADYPKTTASVGKFNWNKAQFVLQLSEPVSAVALRVIGVPSSGDNPKQSYVTCAELRAFAD